MNRPLWVDPDDRHYPSLQGDIAVDVAIVGGGFTGLGAAYALRESGASVALLEARSMASGASGRNAGFVLAGPAVPFGDACTHLGDSEARQLWELTVENNRLISELVDDLAVDCGFHRRGSMSLAASDEEMAALMATLQCLSSAGISACAVRAEDLPRPFDRMYRGGIYYAGNGEINPGAFLRAMAARLRDAVALYESTPVLALEAGKPYALATPGGIVRAASVVLATNAYTARLLPNVPIAPIRGQVLATEPLQRFIVPFPMYANHGYDYWRQTADGRLVVGGRRNLDPAAERGWDEVLHPTIQESLGDFVRTVAGAGVRVVRRWAGIMGFTPDLMPLVGPVPGQEGLFMAAGYSGHGVSMALTCGGLAALMAAGAKVDAPPAFDPARFAWQGGDHIAASMTVPYSGQEVGAG